MFNSIAIFLLSVVIASGMFFDYKKTLRLKWKIILVILIILGNFALVLQNKAKEKTEQERWSDAQWREDARTRSLTEAYRKGPEEKKKSLFDDANQETAQRFLDFNYSRLQNLFGTNRKIDEHYLTVYFTEVNKIPNFYTWEEWKETESLLFNNMRTSLQGYFTNIGRSEHGKTVVAEFTKEREKYIKAKEREFNKGK